MREHVSLHQKEDTSGCSREASWESHDEKIQPPIVIRVINAQAFDAFAPACHPERSEGSGSRGCMWWTPRSCQRSSVALRMPQPLWLPGKSQIWSRERRRNA